MTLRRSGRPPSREALPPGLRLVVSASLLVAGGVSLSACAPSAGSPASAVAQWASGSGIAGLDQTLAGDVSVIKRAHQAGRSLTVKTLCGVLYQDASQAYVQLPSPDARLTDELDRAYLSLSQGATDCYSASGNQQLFNRALGEIETGSSDLAAATSRLAGFGVR